MNRILGVLLCGAALCVPAAGGSSRWKQDEKLAVRRVEVLTAAGNGWTCAST